MKGARRDPFANLLAHLEEIDRAKGGEDHHDAD